MEELEDIHYNTLLAQLADDFFPIFISIVTIILVGYLAGRLNVLPTTRGKSVLASYIFNIALPAGILYNLFRVNLLDINNHDTFLPNFIYGVIIEKTILYGTVVAVGMFLIRRSSANWSVVFLFALAAVHSNDFGIGKPLLHALFDNATSPQAKQYPHYMENSVMLTYMTYVPLTIFFLELKRNRELSLTWGKSIFHGILRSLSRPIVLAVIIGTVLRLSFGEFQPIPTLPAAFKKWFADTTLYMIRMTIPPLYLLYTGLVLVGGAKQFTNPKQIMAIIAVAILKLGVSPILLKLTQCFILYDTSIKSLPILLYIYGTLPTSPIIVIFAAQYDLIPQTFAMVVISTTVCFAPIGTFFLSLYYVSWCQLFSEETVQSVNAIAEGIGYSSVAVSIWIIFVLLILGKYRDVMYRLLLGQVTSLAIYTALTAAIKIEQADPGLAKMTALGKAVASTMFCVLGCTQLLILGITERGSPHITNMIRSLKTGLCYMVSGVLVPCALLALTSLPFTGNPIQKHNYVWDMLDNISNEFVIAKMVIFVVILAVSMLPKFVSCCPNVHIDQIRESFGRLRYQAIEETSDASGEDLREFHRDRMGRRDSANPWEVHADDVCKFQFAGFVAVVMAMMSLLVEVWALVEHAEHTSKSFVGLVLLYQNMWLFAALGLAMMFGTSISEMRDKVVQIKDFVVGCMVNEEEEVALPQVDALSSDTLLTCHRFVKYHLTACISAIGKSVEGSFGTVHEDIFTGEDLVSWLINVGLADDRSDAVEYGSKLVNGRVVTHIDKRRSFYDKDYLYRFTRVSLPANSTINSGDTGTDEFNISTNSGNLPDWF